MNNHLKISILTIVLSGLFFNEIKPQYFYDEMGNYKSFGLNNHETIFPLWLCLTLIGLFVYNIQILNDKKYIV